MIKVLIIILITFLFLLLPYQQIEGFRDKICGASHLNRYNIWKAVKEKYGEKKALTIFPKTYLLPDEINQCLQDKNKHFILKKIGGSFRQITISR